MITQECQENFLRDAEAECVNVMSPLHFFLHIPKCGGTTFAEFLSRNFPRSKIHSTEQTSALEAQSGSKRFRHDSSASEIATFAQECGKTMCDRDLVVGNHFSWYIMQQLVANRPTTLYTIVREPRKRIVSSYNHVRRIPLDHPIVRKHQNKDLYHLAHQLPLDEFCQRTDVFRIWRNLFNLQTRFLSSHHVTYENWSQIGEDEILEDALRNLDKIDFVADISNLNEFTQLISLANQWLPPGRPTTLNQGNYPQTTTSDMTELVPDSHVALDQVIYEAARKKYAVFRDRVLHEVAVKQWRHSAHHQQFCDSGEDWVLDFENVLPAENFHGREGTGGQTFRWMGPDLESRLYLPVRPQVTNWISIYIVAFIKPELYSTTTYFLNGQEVVPTSSTAENCTVLTFPVEVDQTSSGVVELRIKAAETASEVALNLGTDTREKSIAIRRVKVSLRPPG